MADIKLPKTPLVPLFMDHDCRKELDAIIRARDLEVARVVLAGAIEQVKSRYAREAKAMAHYAGNWYAASQYHANRVTAASEMLDVLRALKVSHD
jgi:predicted DNA-binding protein with PD1-like motif